MQKIMFSILLILAIFAVPMVAQDEPKADDPKPDGIEPVKPADPKENEEAGMWADIMKTQEGLKDRSKPRAEIMKLYDELSKQYNVYLEKYWGVNGEHTKQAASFAMSYYAYKKNDEGFYKLSAKCLESDVFDEKFKMTIRIQRIDKLMASEKFEKALEEMKSLKLKEGELTNDDIYTNAVILGMKARIYYGMKKTEEFNKIVEQLEKIMEETKDERTKQLIKYRVMMKISEIKINEGAVAPNWKEVNFAGEEVELSKYKGKYVLLDFWATWCGPCRSAMESHLKPMSEKYKGIADKFVIVSIGTGSRETSEKQEEFVKKMGYTWDFVYDKDGSTLQMYGVSGIPTLIFIGPDGKIIYRGHGNAAEKVVEYLDKKFEIKEEPKEEEPGKEIPEKKESKEKDF